MNYIGMYERQVLCRSLVRSSSRRWNGTFVAKINDYRCLAGERVVANAASRFGLGTTRCYQGARAITSTAIRWSGTLSAEGLHLPTTPIVTKSTTLTTNNDAASTSGEIKAACGTANDTTDDDEMEQEEMFVAPHDAFEFQNVTEWGGPRRGGRLPEPTRFGDWERKGRCTDF